MSAFERQHDQVWDGEERRTARPAAGGSAHHGLADYALLAFAGALVLAELAWLSFLGFVVARALA
jgi:hypothetical protein